MHVFSFGSPKPNISGIFKINKALLDFHLRENVIDQSSSHLQVIIQFLMKLTGFVNVR